MENLLYTLVQERNERETFPFVAIHDSNATLLKEADAWHNKCEQLERQVVAKQESLERIAAAENRYTNKNIGNDGDSSNDERRDESKLVELHYAESAALKNERKMREELGRLRGQVKMQEARHQKDVKDLEETIKSQSDLKELHNAQEQNLAELRGENERQERALEHFNTQVRDSEQRANLAEQQCVGLKDTIRLLQEENDVSKKDYRNLETRFVEEKSRLSSEVNSLNETLERLKVETQRLQSVKKQEEKRQSWFGFASSSSSSKEVKVKATPETNGRGTAISPSDMSGRKELSHRFEKDSGGTDYGSRKVDPVPIVVPSAPKGIIHVHRQEASCVRCDDAGTQMLVTCGRLDGTVNIWNLSDGSAIATLKGGSANSIISCDVVNGLAAGGGKDKTCRVWDIQTQRMLHQLVGHTNVITCVRFVSGGRGIVTASKDRQIKVWNISKQTYQQSVNIVLNSSANSIDIENNSYTIVSGHTDGGLRFWDIRTGQRNAEIKSVHGGAITSVQFHPLDCSKVLTNAMDSRIKIIDIHSCKVMHEFSHKDFQTSYSWSSSVFSPNGVFAASGSSSNGFIFVWNTKNGQLVRVLEEAHQHAGVCGIVWGREGMQSVDKAGKLILWS
mmetsp:Transcript_9991/g.21127  ORF Transcript_9991/g.21127 Transcript_9991/m.21127 type:complete len:620 (-) Transcript_9991:869-2728(-)